MVSAVLARDSRKIDKLSILIQVSTKSSKQGKGWQRGEARGIGENSKEPAALAGSRAKAAPERCLPQGALGHIDPV
jgi:hypothetical protein